MKNILLLTCVFFISFMQPVAAVSVAAYTTTEASVQSGTEPKNKQKKKTQRKQFKQQIKALVKKLKAGNPDASENTVLLAILSILLPPLAVYLHQGEVNNKFWLSLVLTILGWLPGIIYALVVVLGAV